MPKPVEAPTGLSMKFMPIPMIATGTRSTHQKSGESLFKVELSKFVVVFICALESLKDYVYRLHVRGQHHC